MSCGNGHSDEHPSGVCEHCFKSLQFRLEQTQKDRDHWKHEHDGAFKQVIVTEEQLEALRAKLVTATEALESIESKGGIIGWSVAAHEAREALDKLKGQASDRCIHGCKKMQATCGCFEQVSDTEADLRAKLDSVQLAWQQIDEWVNVNKFPDDHPIRHMQRAVHGMAQHSPDTSHRSAVYRKRDHMRILAVVCPKCEHETVIEDVVMTEAEKASKPTCYPCLGEKECEVPGDCRKAKAGTETAK